MILWIKSLIPEPAKPNLPNHRPFVNQCASCTYSSFLNGIPHPLSQPLPLHSHPYSPLVDSQFIIIFHVCNLHSDYQQPLHSWFIDRMSLQPDAFIKLTLSWSMQIMYGSREKPYDIPYGTSGHLFISLAVYQLPPTYCCHLVAYWLLLCHYETCIIHIRHYVTSIPVKVLPPTAAKSTSQFQDIFNPRYYCTSASKGSISVCRPSSPFWDWESDFAHQIG